MPIERHRVFYRGRVQGVGFRFTACRLAQGTAVSGYVRNLPDGRVELVAEGERGEVSEFLDSVARQMAPHIIEVTDNIEPPDSEPLSGFRIRY